MSISGTPEATGVTGSTPLGVLGYAEATANQGSITTLVDLTSLTKTVTVGSGRRIQVTGYAESWASTVASDRVIFYIRESTTTLTRKIILMEPVATNAAGGGAVFVVLTPSAGSHTYKLSAESADSGTVTMNAGTGAPGPAFILVEDIGAA